VTINCPICHSDNPETQRFCGECGTQLPLPQDHPPVVTETLQMSVRELTTGSTFAGRYQIIEELGKGGMGKVYKVFDTKIKEKIALKLIKPEIASDRDTIERFSNELKLARKIRHKNVCGMFDISEAEGAHFITMEYVGGEDLKTMIRMSGMLGLGTVFSVGKQICDGLAEAHSQGVVHRDLKPTNIMIDKEGNARIMDFGISRSLGSRELTGEGVIIGTPDYMSPEQAEGKEADARSDIYSLGVILYEMVTGRVPFEGDTPLAIAVKHKTEVPRDPKLVNAQIPEDLSRVVLKCLEKDKEKRYQSADELHLELEKIEKGIPTTERVMTGRKPFTSKEIRVKFSLKKLLVPSLVTVALIVIAMIIVWRVIPQKAATSARSAKHSIAVLPFEDLSQAKNYESLCDGISETLINALTNIEGLWVPARTSAFFFKGKTLDVREIGQKLGVENVLDGSVQAAEDNLRVTARISNTQDGRQVWSETYNRKMADIFAIQDDIAKAIVTVLKIKLLGDKGGPLVKNYTENLQAYNLYLQGRYFWKKRTAEDIKKAMDCFNQAVALDPKYALAYVGLADCYLLLVQYGRSPIKDVLPKARTAVLKALEIDETLAEAHTSLAMIMKTDWDWENAKKEFKRAIELNPNYTTAHHWYNILLKDMGRLDEATIEIKQALELDPLSLIINVNLGVLLYLKREYDKAIQQHLKTLELDQNFAQGRLRLGECYRQKEMLKEAIAEFQKARTLFGNSPYGLGELGNVYALAGKKNEAIDVLTNLQELLKQGYSVNYDIAYIHFGLGDRDKAFEYLERAYEEKENGMESLKVDPSLDNLRSDPRYKSLIKRMNLE